MNKRKWIIGSIIAIVLVLVSVVSVQLIRYNNIKEYRDLIYLADEELEKENFKAGLGGYIKNLEVKDGIAYRIGIHGMMYQKENYHKMTDEQAQERCEYMAYETNDYEVYYYSLEEVEPFYVGICITNDNGDVLYRGVSDVNNKEPLGTIHMDEGEVYNSRIFYLLDEDVIKQYEKVSGDTVSKEQYPTQTNYRWDFMEVFGGKEAK